jgi:nucleotide-binding universal stress UspA family protein
MKNILVPVDFSDLSIDIVEMAGKFALAFDSKVWIIHVDARQPYYMTTEAGPEIINDMRYEERNRMERDLQSMEEYLRRKGVNAESKLLQGKIVSTILDQCRQLEIDMVVIGSKTFGVFSRTFLGSVSEGVLRKADCPVLILSEHD